MQRTRWREIKFIEFSHWPKTATNKRNNILNLKENKTKKCFALCEK